jgi:WD40 repeat protein
MARVVCQVLTQADRWTLIWSEDKATFEPYTLDSGAVAEVRRLAAQAQEQLARFAGAENGPGGLELAETGHALYQALLGPAEEVRTWWEQQAREGAVEYLEIIGAVFAAPWNIVYDRRPEPAAFARPDGESWQGFWGRRFPVLGGLRVQGLRSRPLPVSPAVVVAIDPALRAALPAEEQKRLSEFISARAPAVAESVDNLRRICGSQKVDFLYVFARADGNAVRLGGDRLTAAELENIVLEEKDDEEGGDSVVFLNACADGAAGSPLTSFAGLANTGLLGPWQPAAPALANRCGLELLQQFLFGGQTLAEAMAAVRLKQPAAGLVFFGSCPAEMHVATEGEAPDEEPLHLPGRPYFPLTPLDEESAALLVGREPDVAAVAELLDDGPARMVLVHGPAGVGKASLLHAGVMPYLEDRCLGYQFIRERAETEEADERDYPVMSIRASSDLAGQLALGLLEFCARPYRYTTPAGRQVTVDLPGILRGAVPGTDAKAGAADLPATEDLRVALRQDPEFFGRILEAVTTRLPFELVVLIENADELLSLIGPNVVPGEAERGLDLFRAALAAPARARYLVSLRTEFVGRILTPLLVTPQDRQQVRAYAVPELDKDALMEVILQPTAVQPLAGSNEVPQDRYRFQYEQGLAEQIATEARRTGAANQESVLVLVHALCGRLYQLVSQRADRVVRARDLQAIGGVDHGLSRYVADTVKAGTSRAERKALNALLLKLFIRQPDGSLTRDVMFENDLKKDWTSATPPEVLVARASGEGARLLEVSYLNVAGREGNFVSLSHDALAPVVAQQGEEATKRSYGWNKMLDVLWVTVPLLVLLGVFAWTRLSAASREMNKAEKELKEAAETNKTLVEEYKNQESKLQGMRWPAYVGQVHAADQAILAQDLVRARQALLSVKPVGEETDLRGFEWFYLWQQMHQDRGTLYGHRGKVAAVALTGDGLLLATADAAGTVRVWNPDLRQEVARFEATSKSTGKAEPCLAFSGDGEWLAGGGEDGILRLWKPKPARGLAPTAIGLAGSLAIFDNMPVAALGLAVARHLPGESFEAIKPPEPIKAHDGAVLAVAFRPDGKTLATAGQDGTIKLWDLSKSPPEVRATLKENAVAFLGAGTVGLSGSGFGDGPLLAASGLFPDRNKQPTAVRALAWSPDGQRLASVWAGTSVHVWEVDKGQKGQSLPAPPDKARVAAVAWSPDGATLATAGMQTGSVLDTGLVKLWDTAMWKERQTPAILVAPVFAVAFTDDGKTLITAGQSNSAQLWDLATGKERFALHGHLGWIRSLASARGGLVVATGGFDGMAKVWRPKDLMTRDYLPVSRDPVHAVVISPDNRWLATGSGDGVVKIWDATTTEAVKSLPHGSPVLALIWGGNGKWLVSAGADGQLKLWDADPVSRTFATELDRTSAHGKDITGLAGIGKDRLVSGSLDGTAKVWTVSEGKFTKEPVVIQAGTAVYSVALMELREGGGRVATGHDDGKVKLWSMTTGKPADIKVPVLTGHTARVTGLSLGDNGQTVFSVSADRMLKLRVITTGEDYYTLRGHGGPITCLAWPNKQVLVTASTDETVKLWTPQILEERWTFQPGIGSVLAVALSVDGRLLAVAGQDGRVRLYRAGPEDAK